MAVRDSWCLAVASRIGKILKRPGVVLSVILAPATAFAQISGEGAWVPGPDQPMPEYFSGTGCVARGAVVCNATLNGLENYFVYATLSIGGTVVKTYVWPFGEPKLAAVTLAAVFDSTEFQHTSAPAVTIYGITNNAIEYSAINYATVLNRSVGFNNFYFLSVAHGNGAEMLRQLMSSTNYSTFKNDGPWTRADIFNEIEDAGVFYENTHGNSDWHTASDSGLHSWNEQVWSYDHNQQQQLMDSYEYWRGVLNGNGTPPFNDSGWPPVHYAQFDSCRSGGDYADELPTTNFDRILLPFFDMNWPNQVMPNQAVQLWKTYTRIGSSDCNVYWIVGGMLQKLTLGDAQIYALVNHANSNHKIWVDHTLSGPGNIVPPTLLQSQYEFPLSGDPYMRIRGVYTNSSDVPQTWFY